jgi:putative spermidine/putrescine transport system ATP-binding protein
MSGLRLSNLVRRYAGFTAVDDLSLEVGNGEFVTLLGPSGCGKTTTLRMVAGFIAPDGGDIWFDDRRMNDVPAHRRNTAMVFQSYALFPHMTVVENVAFGLRMRKLPMAQQSQRINQALEMVSLRGLEKRRPGQLSGGQQQRVALARAIVTQPDILLCDEPLSNLDAKLREKVRLEIRELQRRLGITTLYVTHDQAEALAISDRIVVMNGGRIEQVGDPNFIYRSPRTSFVADFLGAANIVAARAIGNGVMESPVGQFMVECEPSMIAGNVKLSWRPEDMMIAANGSGNVTDARVRNVIFRGNFTELVVEKANQVLRAHVDSDFRACEGDSLDFTVAENRIRIIE